MKTCTKCNEARVISQFWRDRRSRDGRAARCKTCRSAGHKARRRANPDKERERNRRRYQANKTRERERHTLRKYGVSLADYDAMLVAQNGACAVCKSPASKTLDIDHDHASGRVRGLLCTSCNRMIGHAGDDAERLLAAATYPASSHGHAHLEARLLV